MYANTDDLAEGEWDEFEITGEAENPRHELVEQYAIGKRITEKSSPVAMTDERKKPDTDGVRAMLRLFESFPEPVEDFSQERYSFELLSSVEGIGRDVEDVRQRTFTASHPSEIG